MNQVARAALALRQAGISVIPIGTDKRPAYWLLPEETDTEGNVVINDRTGRPKRVWEPYQQQIADEATVHQWFANDGVNVAIIGGRVSGNLGILDFDVDADTVYPVWRERVGELADAVTVIETGKGIHVCFRSEGEPFGNMKLARRITDGKEQVLIETRGEGGYAITAPSYHYENKKNYRAIQGSLLQLPVLTAGQVESLLSAARSFDEMPEPERNGSSVPAVTVTGSFDKERAIAYATGALRNITDELARTHSGGRNNELNRAAFWLGRYVGAGLLSKSDVETALESACHTNGLIRDDGKHTFFATLDSGLGDGMDNPMAEHEIASRLENVPDIDTVEPPLTPEQKTQVERIITRLNEAEYWRGYHEGMTDAQCKQWNQLGIPSYALDLFGLGYCERYINEDTGLIIEDALTIPYRDLNGNVVNIEYRSDSIVYEHEAAAPLYHTDTEAVTTGPALILDDSLSAITTYLHYGHIEPSFVGGDRVQVLGLPHLKLRPDSLDKLNTEYVFVLLGPDTNTTGRGLHLLKHRARFIRLPFEIEHMAHMGFKARDLELMLRQARVIA